MWCFHHWGGEILQRNGWWVCGAAVNPESPHLPPLGSTEWWPDQHLLHPNVNMKYLYHWQTSIHPDIHQTVFTYRVVSGGWSGWWGAYPRCLLGKINPGQVASLSQWQTQRQIIIHGQVKLASSLIPRISVFGLGEEARIPCRTFKHHTAKPLAPRGVEHCTYQHFKWISSGLNGLFSLGCCVESVWIWHIFVNYFKTLSHLRILDSWHNGKSIISW